MRGARRLLGVTMSIFSLFGCGKGREVTREAEAVLAAIPGAPLVLVDTDWTPSWAHGDLNRYHILVAARDDADVQIAVRWSADVAGGGVSATGLVDEIDRARRQVAEARALIATLDRHGLARSSAGVSDRGVELMVFDPLPPERRKAVLQSVVGAITEWPPARESAVSIRFMETEAFGTRYQRIIPPPAVLSIDHWRGDETAYTLNLDPGQTLPSDDPLRHLAFNPESKRTGEFQRVAFEQASKWAAGKIPAGSRLVDNQYYSRLHDDRPRVITFSFPYCPAQADSTAEPECDSAEGYVSATVDTDTGKISGLRRDDEAP